jgi:hypothetical protein
MITASPFQIVCPTCGHILTARRISPPNAPPVTRVACQICDEDHILTDQDNNRQRDSRRDEQRGTRA